MKSLRLGMLAGGAFCLIFQSAQASPLFSEAFDYSNVGGTLGANTNPGSGVQWTGNNNITIASGNLTYAGLQGLPDSNGNSLSVVWGGTSGASVNNSL